VNICVCVRACVCVTVYKLHQLRSYNHLYVRVFVCERVCVRTRDTQECVCEIYVCNNSVLVCAQDANSRKRA